jgi:flagellar hook-basal body complex protein FliE
MVDKIGGGFNAALNQQMSEAQKSSQGQGASNFEEMLKQTLEQTNQAKLESSRLQEGLAAGEHRKIHETMIAAQEAGLSFKMVSEVRGKVVDAYKAIWRMSV